MEVSYTDHSHIIGRGGNTISRVMEDTRCHVHFPDSNRTNQTEKSNLVTVAGELAGVEKARARVRVKITIKIVWLKSLFSLLLFSFFIGTYATCSDV